MTALRNLSRAERILSRKALALARRTALEAGGLLMRRYGRRRTIRFKGSPLNIVTDADRASEALILRRIRGAFPGHDIVAEESAALRQGSPCRWFVDPLDGTTNFAHHYPVWAVSIGFEIDGRMAAGAVYHPALDELFTAVRGDGARLNGRPIRVSTVRRMDQALMATGFPYDIRRRERNNAAFFTAMLYEAQALRRPGSAAIDFCHVAAGRLDAFWEIALGPWDLAAGALIVEEAGGRATDFSGRPPDLFRGEVLASNGRVHDDVLRVIRRVEKKAKRTGWNRISRV